MITPKNNPPLNPLRGGDFRKAMPVKEISYDDIKNEIDYIVFYYFSFHHNDPPRRSGENLI